VTPLAGVVKMEEEDSSQRRSSQVGKKERKERRKRHDIEYTVLDYIVVPWRVRDK
jgi:hypothetical protein